MTDKYQIKRFCTSGLRVCTSASSDYGAAFSIRRDPLPTDPFDLRQGCETACFFAGSHVVNH